MTKTTGFPTTASCIGILDALADECIELGGLADELQSLMSQALMSLAHDPDCHLNAQRLDLLSQRLSAVAAYTKALVRLVPPAWHLDLKPALNEVSLSALARRLHGMQPLEAGDEPGDVNIF